MLDPTYFGPVHCNDRFCIEEAPTWDQAAGLGWRQVHDLPHCPLHWPQASRKARIEDQQESFARRANEITARKELDKGWYAAWDEFQSDLADFHRATGRHAHKNVRMMTPQQFRDEYRRAGRINVKNAHEAAHAAENAWKEQLKRVL